MSDVLDDPRAEALARINRDAKPGCRRDVVTGDVTPRAAMAVARRFVTARFEGHLASFVFGSAAQTATRPYSDIDLVVVEAEREYCETIRTMFEGVPVEVHVLDRVGFLRGLALAGRTGIPNVALEVAEAALLTGVTEATSWFQERARDTRRQGPPAATPDVKEMLARTLTVRLTGLLQAPAAPERTALAESCATLLYLTHFIRQGMWRYSGKWAPRKAPDLAAELEAGFEEVRAGVAAEGLLRVAERELAPWGGFQWAETRSVLWPGKLARVGGGAGPGGGTFQGVAFADRSPL